MEASIRVRHQVCVKCLVLDFVQAANLCGEFVFNGGEVEKRSFIRLLDHPASACLYLVHNERHNQECRSKYRRRKQDPENHEADDHYRANNERQTAFIAFFLPAILTACPQRMEMISHPKATRAQR